MKRAELRTPPSSSSQAHRETAANYRRVIITYGRFRVAVCRDGIQWLFQKCTREKPVSGAYWKNIGYFVAREQLIALQNRSTGAEWPELKSLPESFSQEEQE